MFEKLTAWIGRLKAERDAARAALQRAQTLDRGYEPEHGHDHSHAEGAGHPHDHSHGPGTHTHGH